MQKKAMLISGVLLTIIFSFALVFSLLLALAYGILLFLGNSFPFISDLISPIVTELVKSFGDYGALYVILGIIVLIIITIISTNKFIKYSKKNDEIIDQKRKTLITSMIILLLAMGAQTYLFIISFNFVTNLLLSMVQIVSIGIEIISIILCIITIARVPHITEIVSVPINEVKRVVESKPAIYTGDLDDEPAQVIEDKQEEKEDEQPVLKESITSQKLIEGIGKLDQMRKEGAITAAEYTRLRGQMIKKFVK